MKRKSTLLLALGLCCSMAMAQNVIVVMKDGTSRKFNADYLKEISFKEKEPEKPSMVFDKIGLDVYSGGNVMVTLTDEETQTVCELDMYVPKDHQWLHAGTYEVASSSDPFKINSGYSAVVTPETRASLSSGTVVVTIDEAGIYTINVDVKTSINTEVKGVWTGDLPAYKQTISEKMSEASYSKIAQKAGIFYVKLHDTDYKYEMALVFVADKEEKVLPAGTYTYSQLEEPGTITPTSYVDCFRPNANLRLVEGSEVTVEKDGDTYSFGMKLNLTDGRVADFTFKGEIKGTPEFE